MVILKPWMGAALLGVMLSGCWSPLFDSDISLAAMTSTKLSRDLELTYLLTSNSNESVYWAVPSRERVPTSLALMSLGPTSFGMTILTGSGSNWTPLAGGWGQSFTSPLSDPNLVTVVPADPAAVSFAVLLPSSEKGLLRTNIGVAVQTSPLGPPYTLGYAGLASVPVSPTQVNAYMVTFTGSTLAPASTPSSSGSGFPAPAVGGSWASYSGSATYGWLAWNQGSSVAYLTHSVADAQGRYTTDQFNAAGMISSWTRTDRVVTFLTTGQLLTRDGAYYLVCDASGNPQFSFAAGSLKFGAEYYDAGGTARCSFTTMVRVDGGEQQSAIRVTVYSIETAQLDSLK